MLQELPIPPAVAASLVAAGIASIGLTSAVITRGWAERNSPYFTAFAAGVLVTTALTLFPEAALATPVAPFAALLGYLTLYGINLAFKRSAGSVIAPLFAIGLHSFMDGLEYGILFEHDSYVGLLASVGLIAHEFAEGVILYAVLKTAGLRTTFALAGAFLGAAVTTPLGALASQPVLAELGPVGLGTVLAGAAGALLYVGATHLPTHLSREGKSGLIVVYLLGVALSLSLTAAHSGLHTGHAHEDHEEARPAPPLPNEPGHHGATRTE